MLAENKKGQQTRARIIENKNSGYGFFMTTLRVFIVQLASAPWLKNTIRNGLK
jgi:hypothetical protein